VKNSVMALASAALVLATQPAMALESKSFRSPSGNIYCYAGVDDSVSTVQCELLERTNGKPVRPVPSDCDLDWGNRFALDDSGRAYLVCAGDTLRDDGASTLRYGKRIDYYGITCSSSEQGMECINDDGHGFKISKGKQQLY
jgi:hypothetical protein